jgi:uncharacterized integral membrane protein (TIGR00698 family)
MTSQAITGYSPRRRSASVGAMTQTMTVAKTHGTSRYAVGVLVTGLGAGGAAAMHAMLPQVGLLTWAVALGVATANAGLLPRSVEGGTRLVTHKALRAGIVLLGLSLSAGSVIGLGLPMIVVVVTTSTSTLLATFWLGRRLGLARPRSLLIATGFAICGASAIAAMEETSEADEEDVTVAIAMVTVFGTVAMVAMPLLQAPLGLSATAYGAWAGASVQEVGQVVAAAGPAGQSAVAIAVVVKLTRVLLLAPVVALAGVRRRRCVGATEPVEAGRRLPPLVPVFVAGFLLAVTIRSTGVVPQVLLGPAATLQNLVLAAALFGMGTAVRARALLVASRDALTLAALSTLVVASVSLVGVLLAV